MPAIKKRTDKTFKFRDHWGDEIQGMNFERLINDKFGTEFGSRGRAIAFLGITRRLFNMYISGERNVPDERWSVLRELPDYDDIDPLS